jgi:Lar family restriction alleviation protein
LDFCEIEGGLKTCPFCGGEAGLNHVGESDGNIRFLTAYVVCCDCGARTRSFIIDGYYGVMTTEDDAIEAWNRRVV